MSDQFEMPTTGGLSEPPDSVSVELAPGELLHKEKGQTVSEAIAERKVVAPIAIDRQSQQLVARDNSELMRMISIFMAGQAFPKTMDTPAKCITAWNLAASFKNVSPQRAMSRMMYINNTLSIWGELPKALAEATGELEDYEIYVVDKDFNKICVENKNLLSDPVAGICNIKRKGRTKNQYYFTMAEAERAGLLKKTGPWQTYAKAMLCWRASGQGLKFDFSDALMGCEIAEYRFNESPELKDVTEKPKSLNEKMDDVSKAAETQGQASAANGESPMHSVQ